MDSSSSQRGAIGWRSHDAPHHMPHCRAQHWLAIALCPDCHTGPQGIHGNRQRLKARKLDEMDLLALTIEQLNP